MTRGNHPQFLRASAPSLAQIVYVLLAAAVAHGVSLGGHLLYDDLHSVRDNDAIRSLANLPRFFVDPSAFSTKGAMYRPVVLSTLAIDHTVGSGGVWAFKLGNLVLHGLTSLLLLRLGLRLRIGRDLAFGAALLFAVHPLGSEAVHVISSRSDQLVALGLLWAMVAQLGPRPRAVGTRVQVACATLVAVGSKETGVVVPAMVGLIEWMRWTRGRSSLRASLHNLLAPALVAVVYLIARQVLLGKVAVAMPPIEARGDQSLGATRGLTTQFAVMGQVLPRFMAQGLVPFGLSIDPPFDLKQSPGSLQVVCGWLSVLLATGFGLSRPRSRFPLFLATCGAWSLALPWVLVPLNAPAGEHRVYGCLAFGLLGLASLLCEVRRGMAGRRTLRRLPAPGPAPRVAVAAVLIAFTAVSVDRGTLHLEPERLWRATLESNPRSYAARTGLAYEEQKLGQLAAAQGRQDEARTHFQAALHHTQIAITIFPRRMRVRESLIASHLQLGYPIPAWIEARELARVFPRKAYPRILHAQGLVQASRVLERPELARQAEEIALSCLRIAEPKALVFRTAASAAEAAGEIATARAHFAESRRRGLVFPELVRDEARFELRQGNLDRARALGFELQSLEPSDPAVFEILQLAAPR